MSKKSAREDMLELTRELFDKATFNREYTQEDAIDELYSRLANLKPARDFLYVAECYEIACVIETAIMVGCFGAINDFYSNR